MLLDSLNSFVRRNCSKDVWYNKGQKMHNFTFDARFRQWYVQFPHTAKNLCPTLFHTGTVKPKRRGCSLLYHTTLIRECSEFMTRGMEELTREAGQILLPPPKNADQN